MGTIRESIDGVVDKAYEYRPPWPRCASGTGSARGRTMKVPVTMDAVGSTNTQGRGLTDSVGRKKDDPIRAFGAGTGHVTSDRRHGFQPAGGVGRQSIGSGNRSGRVGQIPHWIETRAAWSTPPNSHRGPRRPLFWRFRRAEECEPTWMFLVHESPPGAGPGRWNQSPGSTAH